MSDPSSIGRYRVLREIGRGGMGVVFAANDPELGRDIAIKMLHRGADADQRERLRREARAAAAVTHPNICQLYEIGEADGQLFIAMELVEGEPLSDSIAKGPLPPRQAAEIESAILRALDAIHACGIVHRDLKPSNVIITPHGVKLVDFGLARAASAAADATSAVTLPGTVVGTPRYMAPEQLAGREADARADLFAAGCVLFELLAGRPAFDGRTFAEIVHAIGYEHPPTLTGSPAVAALDRVIHRALAKAPANRYATAAAMVADLEAIVSMEWSSSAAPAVRAMTRLIVLPLRLLRPDADIDFLGYSLADAITTSLAGLQSLVVRSTAAATPGAGAAPDLKRLAADADVDVALVGTILRAGDQLRVSTQLVEVPAGTVLWSHTAQVGISDIFALQDALTTRIVESLSVPLSAREEKLLRHDVPATARAYEFYLKANQLALDAQSWGLALKLYRQCVSEDPAYAPAWARLARVCRLMAKYGGVGDRHADWQREADDALERSLDLNPDLPFAHTLAAHMEIDRGDAEQAMVRLIARASIAPDAQLLAGLVQACRYCGLLAESLDAHEQAMRINRAQPTSVIHTQWAMEDYEPVLEHADSETLGWMRSVVLVSMGRIDDARALLAPLAAEPVPAARLWHYAIASALDGRPGDCIDACERILTSHLRDPEAVYHVARMVSRAGYADRALELFTRAVDDGYFNVPLFERDPWLDPRRTDARFTDALDRARARRQHARDAFDRAGGRRLFAMAKQVS